MRATTILNTTTTVLSFALLAATFTPARADANPVQAKIERSIASTMKLPSTTRQGVATVSVHVNADGSVGDATLMGTTGTPAFDKEAMRTAHSVSYPTGSARQVVMVLGFGRTVTAADRAKGEKVAAQYRTDTRQLLASKTTVQPVS